MDTSLRNYDKTGYPVQANKHRKKSDLWRDHIDFISRIFIKKTKLEIAIS